MQFIPWPHRFLSATVVRFAINSTCLLCFTVAGCLLIAEPVQAQVPALSIPAPPIAPDATQPFDADHKLNQLITRLVLKEMPHQYERNKGWGAQDERWDGIKWDHDGWEIRTHRRKKLVNHGMWRKYSASLADPEHQFDVTVTNIHQTANDRLGFQINFMTRLNLFARQAEWVKGVQLYSLSATGHATVRLTVDIEMEIALDPTRLPPDVIFQPRATSADLIVDEFRIDRISKLGGEFAIQVTNLARKELDDEIAEKEVELVTKINKAIDKNADDLRVSLADAMQSKWTDAARPFLPAAIKKAVGKKP